MENPYPLSCWTLLLVNQKGKEDEAIFIRDSEMIIVKSNTCNQQQLQKMNRKESHYGI